MTIVALMFTALLLMGETVGHAGELKLPDTLGIALGMPVIDAVQRMKELGLRIDVHETNPSNILKKPLLHELHGDKTKTGNVVGESLNVSIATPPHAQVVWRSPEPPHFQMVRSRRLHRLYVAQGKVWPGNLEGSGYLGSSACIPLAVR